MLQNPFSFCKYDNKHDWCCGAFQDLQFRSWWNCSGYTGVPLYKIMMKNRSLEIR